MSESARSYAPLDAVVCWSDTRDPSNGEHTSTDDEPVAIRANPDQVTAPDLTAVVMLVALAVTAIGLSASGVIYLFNELLSYRSTEVLDLVAGIR